MKDSRKAMNFICILILIKEFVKIWDLNKNYTNICTTLMWKNYTVWVILSAMKTILLLWEIYTLTFLVCIRRTTRFSKRHVKVTSSLWKIQHFFIKLGKKVFFGSISNVYKCNDSEELFSYILCKDKTNFFSITFSKPKLFKTFKMPSIEPDI